MGLGAGYAIAACLLEKMKPAKERCPVLCIQGDSAFGFAGMEFETACRLVYSFRVSASLHFLSGYGSMATLDGLISAFLNICVDLASKCDTHYSLIDTTRYLYIPIGMNYLLCLL